MAPPLSPPLSPPPDATPSAAVVAPVAAPAVDAAWARRLVDGWVTARLGLAPTPAQRAEQAALADRWPDWEARAAGLIAEGLLAYVAVEMVAPDLAVAAAAAHRGVHGLAHAEPSDAELAARLGAHLRDFVDYRDHLGSFGRRAASPF